MTPWDYPSMRFSPASQSSGFSILPRSSYSRAYFTSVKLADGSVEKGRAAVEMMLIGSSIKVAPVVQWDGQKISDGKPGPIALKLLEMWNEDARSATNQLVAVPYGET